MIRITIILLATACAPPLGVGPPPSVPPRSGFATSLSTSYALSGSRESVQGSGAVTFRLRKKLLLEAGLVATTTRAQPRGQPKAVVSGGFPYLRPTLVFGRLQIGVALAGAAIGAGGGGAYFGVAEGRLSFQNGPLGIWTSALASTAESIGGPRSRGRHLAFGTEWRTERLGTRLGIGAEVRLGNERFICGPKCSTALSVDDRFSSLVIKLRVLGGSR